VTDQRRAQPSAVDGYVRGTPPRADIARRSLVFAVVAAFAVFAVLAQLGDGGIVSWFRLRAEEQELRREVADLETHNGIVEAQLEALTRDQDALERLARENLGMRRPDEEVVTVLRADAVDSEKPARSP